MNEKDPRYSSFTLVREMLEVPETVRRLNLHRITSFADRISGRSVLLSGEGSSRIFPAKKVIADSWRHDYKDRIHTEAATQALEYDLGGTSVFIASNSGKTKEGVRLLRRLSQLRGPGQRRGLGKTGTAGVFGVVANAETPIADEADAAYVLACGGEKAVAATKSVVEQALFYDIVFRARNGQSLPDLARLAEHLDEALRSPPSSELLGALTSATMLYWAGRNDGVAEELTLKTNEITRQKSDFLEGSYAAHGIEEVMESRDAVVVVDPFPEEEEKFEEVLVKGVGLAVVAIAQRDTRFPSFRIPSYDDFTPYIQLCAGWNLLVEIGLGLGVDIDHPIRARKIGNEFPG